MRCQPGRSCSSWHSNWPPPRFRPRAAAASSHLAPSWAVGGAVPPQPQQQQGVEYFAGAWTFTYTGRESPVTSGPRSGTVTFSRRGSSNVLEVRTEGQIEGGGAFRDTGTFEWNDADKQMTMTERLANGTEITSVGNWSSPLTIRAESRPVQVGGQSVRLRRVYSIVSAQAFTVSEDISVDGGPFQRLGAGQFSKAVK